MTEHKQEVSEVVGVADTPKQEETGLDAKTVMYVFYILFKANIISRNNLANVIQVIRTCQEKDIVSYLVSEAGKI